MESLHPANVVRIGEMECLLIIKYLKLTKTFLQSEIKLNFRSTMSMKFFCHRSVVKESDVAKDYKIIIDSFGIHFYVKTSCSRQGKIKENSCKMTH